MNAVAIAQARGEFVERVRAHSRVLAVGAGTKSRLMEVPGQYQRVSTLSLSGIVQYDPAEYTITALAGTRISDLHAVLARHGQYLPVDPLFARAGATLGGSAAAGTNGPGRFRFGGMRDFILGVEFMDGAGRLLRAGGKVVKNAAGFDLPKFLIGSLGRFGVITEITCKVFPRPEAALTVRFPAKNPKAAVEIFTRASNSRWEVDALDRDPSGDVLVRLAGPSRALPLLAQEILSHWPGQILADTEAQAAWSSLTEASWAHPGGVVIKIVLTPPLVIPLAEQLARVDDARLHVSAGGNVAFVSFPSESQARMVDELLQRLSLSAITLRGKVPLWMGCQSSWKIARAVKHALDPEERFPSLEE